MADFPLFINMKDRKVMIIGGGAVALRKVRILMAYDADITVMAENICEELKKYREMQKITHLCRNMTTRYLTCLEGAFLVICASDDPDVNRMSAAYCHAHQILVNCADPGEVSDCIFPSVIQRDNIVVGISTSGGVPALTRYLREKIEAVIPEWYGELEVRLRKKRTQLKQSGLSQGEKRELLRQWIRDEEEKRGWQR